MFAVVEHGAQVVLVDALILPGIGVDELLGGGTFAGSGKSFVKDHFFHVNTIAF
jgi:hypothetical protein